MFFYFLPPGNLPPPDALPTDVTIPLGVKVPICVKQTQRNEEIEQINREITRYIMNIGKRQTQEIMNRKNNPKVSLLYR